MEPIAIIGLSYKLPGGIDDDTAFWDVLSSRTNVMKPWPSSRANIEAFHQLDVSERNIVTSRGGHFRTQDPAVFDAPFFSLTAQEALSMDPQQRWLLETSYHAFENAGIPLHELSGTDTAVLSSSMTDDFMRIVSKDPENSPIATATGTTACILANRLSWFFDFKGPSIQVNTACSSSMVALDIACQTLRSGQSSMALATGSNVLLSPETSIYLSKMNFLSPDGLCYSFDHRANGYARGEGVVVLVLKRLSDAIRHKNNIRAVIRGTGSNQDGRTPGLTQPSLSSQEDLIRSVYKSVKLDFSSTRYIEAHGTGTQIGDITEARAIGRVFKSCRSSKEPLYIGSVKANIGHLEGCSGLAGVIKSILILEKGLIPPNALFERWNPKINAKAYNIEVPTSCIPWPGDGLRRVSINSFGFGGSNGHVILDDAFHTLQAMALKSSGEDIRAISALSLSWNATVHENTLHHASGQLLPCADIVDNVIPDPPESRDVDTNHAEQASGRDGTFKHQLLVWSARDEAALRRMLQDYSKYIDTAHVDSEKVNALAYTLAARRTIMAWRAFDVASPEVPLQGSRLSSLIPVRSSKSGGLAFIFTGQGAQYPKMGRELLCYAKYRSTLHKTAQIYKDLGAKWWLLDELRDGSRMHLPEISQPLCTALQVALVELLREFNIVPDVVVGHSSGEIAAAYSVGALSIESSCMVAYHRGRLAGQLAASTPKPGAMMAVNLPEKDAEAYVAQHLSMDGSIHVACVNSPTNITLSGDEAAIDKLKHRLDQDGIFAQKVPTGVAYHSPAMTEISDEYRQCLGVLQRGKPNDKTALMISSVTGLKAAHDYVSTAEYWVENLVSPVRFADALRYLVSAAPRLDGLKTISDHIEVGPHGALQRSIKDTITEATGNKAFRSVSVLSRNISSLTSTMQMAGQLFVHGHPVSIVAVNRPDDRPLENTPFVPDMPEYPFDHSQLHWQESRLSRDWRQREASQAAILGLPTADWNPLEPRWRKILNTKDVSWITDHVIGNDIFLPATGMLAMAVEAVKQTTDSHGSISGYLIKEASFLSPIVVFAEKDTEIVTHLRLLRHTFEKKTSRFEVRLFTCVEHRQWTEAFRGVVHVEYQETSVEADSWSESDVTARTFVKQYEQATRSATNHFDKDALYQWLHTQGLKYGKSFALANNICWDGRTTAVASIDVPQMPDLWGGVAHPAVLDASCHICVLAPSDGISRALPTMIPAKMQNAWISARGLSQFETVRAFSSSARKVADAGIECSITVLTDDGLPLYHVERLDMLPITGNGPIDSSERLRVYGIDWKPHLPFMSPIQIRQYCDSTRLPTQEDVGVMEQCLVLEEVLREILWNHIDRLPATERSSVPSQMEEYLSWVGRGLGPAPAKNDEADTRQHQLGLGKKIEFLRETQPSWNLFIEAAQDLSTFLCSEVDGDRLVALSTLAQGFYDNIARFSWDGKITALLSLAAHQNPSQTILNVGAAPWSIAPLVFSALRRVEQETGGIAYSRFIIMDQDTSRLATYKEQLAKDDDRVSTRAIQPISESARALEPGTFDLIIIDSALRNAAGQDSALASFRRALKPRGHLIIHDPVPSHGIAAAFGICALPLWKQRQAPPTSTVATRSDQIWDVTLKGNGFTGNDLVLKGANGDDANAGTIIFSTASEQQTVTRPSARVILVVRGEDELRDGLLSGLSSHLHDTGHSPEIFSFPQLLGAGVTPDDVVIWLADLDRPLLDDLSASSFDLLREWIKQTQNLIWVSRTTQSPEAGLLSYPHAGLKDGLLRSLRLEFNEKLIVSITLETDSCDAEFCVKSVLAILSSTFEAPSQDEDVEYLVRDGHILTGRLVVDADVDTARASLLGPQVRTEPWNSGAPLKLDIASRGSLDTLRFVEDLDRSLPLGPTEVEIEARGWGVNFRDVFIALGRLEEDDFGTDCAGVVTRVGSECRGITPGDRVCMCVTGCMRAYPRADQLAVAKIPDSVSFDSACAIIGPALTAWHSLVDVARLQQGESILIHSASGATGQLAIQVAQMIGAEVFVTVGSDHKKRLLMDTYSIPEDHILFSRNTCFSQGIMRMTDARGVDVILNSLVGESLRASWECIAPYGRFIEIGKADIYANATLPMGHFAKNVSFMAVDLRHLMLHRPLKAHNLLLQAIGLVQGGKVHNPEPLHVYGVGSVEDAFRYIQSGKNTGRSVIRIEGAAEVKKQIVHRTAWSFERNATYMVVGGLGGVGRLLLRWMVSKGAMHIIVPSRSGVNSQPAATLVQEMAEKGVSILAPQCDVASSESLSRMLEEYSGICPPIRGCINAAMALNSSTFDKMRHSQWEATLRSKAQTSWNLCRLLPKKLDFIIFLASTTGVVGNVGAPNYAAGCAFQDVLAQAHERVYGEKVLSIDLGVMGNVGVVAETVFLQKVFQDSHSRTKVENEDLLALLDICCDPARRLHRRQIVMGLPTPADLVLQGSEPSEALQRPLLAHFRHAAGLASGSSAPSRPKDLFEKAKDGEEKIGIVVQALVQKVARTLSVNPVEVEKDKPLHGFGVDSLLAVELRNWMKNEFGAQIPVFEITGGKTVELLAELICKTSELKTRA
ncbi:polyketide synthase PksD [Xylariaceae sp. FL0594]|nr:polyketide synthase PksD [Xylariaceae sp. FL0594]